MEPNEEWRYMELIKDEDGYIELKERELRPMELIEGMAWFTRLKEEWRPIEGYEDYLISNFGRVQNRNSKGRFMKCRVFGEYLEVRLRKHGIAKNLRVHRLVAKAFIPNPDGVLQVEHIDENMLNNFVSNLRWAEAYKL